VTPRARWYLRVMAVAIVWTVAGLAFAAIGERPAAVVALGAAATLAIQARAMVFVFRRGFYVGRGTVYADVRRVQLGGVPDDPSLERNPWDAYPAWPDDELAPGGDPGHTAENGT
jgi:hypothetical protein